MTQLQPEQKATKATKTPPVDAEGRPHPYKMREICERTGLERQTVHYYIQEGLLPPGLKTGRNVAWYGDVHLERIRTIQTLQRERFLPLKAIKAILDGRETQFSPQQSEFLAGIREQLGRQLAPPKAQSRLVPMEDVLARSTVSEADIREACDLGLVGFVAREDGGLDVAEDDVWMFELFGSVREVGFTKELGFGVGDLAFYDEIIGKLLDRELGLLSSRLSALPPAEVAVMVERALPIIHSMLMRLHISKVREFLRSL